MSFGKNCMGSAAWTMIILLLLFSAANAASQDDTRLLVMFGKGVVSLPAGRIEALPSEINSQNPQISDAFSRCNLQKISKTLPAFCAADTLRVLETGRVIHLTDWSNLYTLSMSSVRDAESLFTALKGVSGVVFVEKTPPPPRLFDWPIGPPDDPNYSCQWHLDNPGGPHDCNPYSTLPVVWTEDVDIDAAEAWQITTGTDVVVGVLDGGVYGDSYDLVGRVTGDFEGGDILHGTAVAGVIAAKGNNDSMVTGINWNARIHSEDIESEGRTISAGVVGAITAGSKIINCSWGTDYIGGFAIDLLAFADAYKSNIFVSAAMGNTGNDSIQYPAAFNRYATAVGEIDETGAPCEESTSGDHIDVCAPGGDRIHTLRSDNEWPYFQGSFGGTSAAAAIVSGIASLLLSYRPDLSNDDVKNLIEVAASFHDITGFPGTAPGWDEKTGYGLVNANDALELLRPPSTLRPLTSGGSGSAYHYVKEGIVRFVGVPGVSDYQPYAYELYKVTKTVHFARLYARVPSVWGRGVYTTGLNSPEAEALGSDYCFGASYTGVSSITSTQYLLSTYVYKLYYVSGGFFRWTPCDPSQVEYAYSILGIEDLTAPTATVNCPNGGEHYSTLQTIPITWTVQDEYLPGVRCGVSINYNGGTGIWTLLASDIHVDNQGNGHYEYVVPAGTQHEVRGHCRIRVVANDSNQHQGVDASNDDFTIEYLVKPGGEPIPIDPTSPRPTTPKENFLSAPYPNPCNPSTSIRFGLKEPAVVSLKVYDINGRVVKVLYDSILLTPREYLLNWDARNDRGTQVASGVYFLRLKAGQYSKTQRMVVLK